MPGKTDAKGTAVTSVVVVSNKPSFADPAALEVQHWLEELGLHAQAVRCARLYRVGGATAAGLKTLATGLLCDPVTQQYLVEAGDAPNGKGKKTKEAGVRVDIWLKAAVSDPVGPSVERGARQMDVNATVRCGQRVEVLGEASEADVRDAVVRAVANPLIHECTVQRLDA